MTSFWQDIRYSLRMIAKAPGFAAIAILTLALGIGANTTIFSWINSTLLNPVPGLGQPERGCVADAEQARGKLRSGLPIPISKRCATGSRVLRASRRATSLTMSLTGKGKPERVWGMVASANYFDVLGVRPILGRGFLPAEDEKPGGAPVAVISYRLWQTHFGANPNIVGQTIEINQHPYTIVGVTPAAFQGSQTGVRTEIWVPIMMEEQVDAAGRPAHDHHYFWLLGVWTVEAGRHAGAGAGGNDAATEAGGEELSRGAQRARQCDGVSAVAESIWLESCFSRRFCRH